MAEENLGIDPLTSEEYERDTLGFYRDYGILSAEKGMPGSKDTNRFEACVDLPWQFGPGSSLEFDSEYITVDECTLPAKTNKSTDLELEWQWIIDQQQANKAEWLDPIKVKDGVPEDAKEGKNGERGIETESWATSSLFSGQKTEGFSDAGTSGSSRASEQVSMERKSPKVGGVSWQTASSKELAALLSRKSHEYMENCDLPPSKSSHAWTGPTSSPADSTKSSQSSPAHKLFLASLLHGEELPHFESCSLPSSSPSTLGSRQVDELPSSSSAPQTISSVANRSKDQTTRPQKRVDFTELLGEALCHSQTRARQAEKLAAETLQEREKLAQLLCRESWTARTYKQWVHTLELENKWLNGWAESGVAELLSDPLSPRQLSINRRKRARKPVLGKKMQDQSASRHHGHGLTSQRGNIWLHCTLGFAFALGLSFAGAGLMIGWSMGWILLRY